MTNSNTGRERLQRLLDQAVTEHGLPGIVAEVQDEHGTWFGSAGLADRSTGRRREPGEYLHFGSIGKAHTAATLLQLEAEGRLSIDDTVEQWLPGVANANGNDGSKLVIRQLLNHTSGLFATGLSPVTARLYFSRAAVEQHRHDVWSIEDLVKLAVSEPPTSEPGTDFRYANGGFYLAGAIIEKVTGNSYADEVRRTLLEPLGLTSTYARPHNEAGYPDPHPRAYSNKFVKEGVAPEDVTPENWQEMMEDTSLEPLDVTDMTFPLGFAAGNIVSTTREMIRFFNALMTGELLPPAQHRAAWTTVSTEGANWIPNVRYGLGLWELILPSGRVLRGGGGSAPGSESFVVGTPDGRSTIALHSNCDGKALPVFFGIVEAQFDTAAG